MWTSPLFAYRVGDSKVRLRLPGSEAQHQLLVPGARAARHHPRALRTFGRGEDEVAMVDAAGQHRDLARAAQAFLAVAAHVDVGGAQGGEQGLVGTYGHDQAGIGELDLE